MLVSMAIGLFLSLFRRYTSDDVFRTKFSLEVLIPGMPLVSVRLEDCEINNPPRVKNRPSLGLLR